LRQILYVSSSTRDHSPADLPRILEQSRHNNAIDGITGLLWSDGRRFLQVLEGPEESVAAAFKRIGADPRHRAVVVLSDRTVEEREFGGWTMALRNAGEGAAEFDRRARAMLAGASPQVRGTFLGLIEARAAV